jgi:hypothetical protein
MVEPTAKLGYKPVQHVPVLNTIGNYNTNVSICVSKYRKGTIKCGIKDLKNAGRQWLTPVILATQEAEIRRIMVLSQPRQKKFARPYLE